MGTLPEDLKSLKLAELHFRFAIHVSSLCNAGPGLPEPGLVMFTFGEHTMYADEIAVPADKALIASVLFEHSATYLLCLTMNKVLEKYLGKDRQHTHPEKHVRDTCQVIRLLRNAFAHDPFLPTWEIGATIQDASFEVPGILTLKTKGKNDQEVDRLHYGGPIALLRTSKYVRDNMATWQAQML